MLQRVRAGAPANKGAVAVQHHNGLLGVVMGRHGAVLGVIPAKTHRHLFAGNSAVSSNRILHASARKIIALDIRSLYKIHSRFLLTAFHGLPRKPDFSSSVYQISANFVFVFFTGISAFSTIFFSVHRLHFVLPSHPRKVQMLRCFVEILFSSRTVYCELEIPLAAPAESLYQECVTYEQGNHRCYSAYHHPH